MGIFKNAFGISVAFFAVIAISGCTMAPQYTKPASPVPANWPTGAAYIYIEKNAADESTPLASALSWREFITDIRMQKIIEIALNNNRDLRLAALNVERAQALYGIAEGRAFPYSSMRAGFWIKSMFRLIFDHRIRDDLSTNTASISASVPGRLTSSAAFAV